MKSNHKKQQEQALPFSQRRSSKITSLEREFQKQKNYRESDRDNQYQTKFTLQEPKNVFQRNIYDPSLRQTANFNEIDREIQRSALTSIGGVTNYGHGSIQFEQDYRSPTTQSGYMQDQLRRGNDKSSSSNYRTLNSQEDYYRSKERSSDQSRIQHINNFVKDYKISQEQSPSSMRNSHIILQQLEGSAPTFADPNYQSVSQNDENLHDDLLEQQVIQLRQKMKNLETKYIDLANFYKKEALFKNQQPQIKMSNTSENFYSSNRSLSPLRSNNQLDQTIEKNIINQLFQEKGDIEQQLQDIMSLQHKKSGKESILLDKIESLEKQCLQLQNQKSNSSISRELIDKIKDDLSLLLQRFEIELLEYINNNYNSFTEKDIQSLFGNLKDEMSTLIDMNIQEQQIQQQKLLLSSTNLGINGEWIQQLDQHKQQIIAQFQKDQNEFELNMGYLQQKLKKNIFDLQNKHDTVLLDLKKSQIAVSTLMKTTQDLNRMGSNQRAGSQIRDGVGVIDLRRTNGSNFAYSPPRSSYEDTESRANINEIQFQLKLLLNTFNSLNQKLNSLDFELQNLNNLEEDCQENLNFLANAFDTFISHLPSIQFSSSQDLDALQIELEDQKQKAESYSQDLKFATDKINDLRQENSQLLDQIERLRNNQANESPNFKYQRESVFQQRNNMQTSNQKQFSYSSSSGFYRNENNNAQIQIDNLKLENQSLVRRISILSKAIEEKNTMIDRISQGQVQNQNKLNQSFNSNYQQERALNYKQYAEKQNSKLLSLIKLTRKFLVAMRKLQNVVHKKQQNVQIEKGEFDQTRKDLEAFLKILKKENLGDNPMISPRRLERPTNEYALSVNRISPFTQERESSNERQYQNADAFKNQYETSHKHQPSSSTVLYDNLSSFKPTQENPSNFLSHLQHQMITRPYEESKQSPIMLRVKKPLETRNNGQNFRSIETLERRNNLISQASLDRNQRSPSLEQQLQQRLQSSNKDQSEVSLLQKELREVKREREQLASKLVKTEREKDTLTSENHKLEIKLDRLEKQVGARDFKPDNLSSKLTLLEQEIKEQQEVNSKLHEKLSQSEKFNNEQKRTIQVLEENATQAKDTLIELQEKVTRKEIEIAELKQETDVLKKNNGNKIQKISTDEIEIKKVKAEIMVRLKSFNFKDKIEKIEQEQEDRLQDLENMLQNKEFEINKLKRMLERKIKEKEIQQQNMQQEQEMLLKIQEQQQIIKDLEDRFSDETSQKLQLTQEIQQKAKQLQNLQQQYQSEKLKLENQIQQLEREKQDAIEEMKLEFELQNSTSIEQLELQIQNLKKEQQREIKKLKADQTKEKEIMILQQQQEIQQAIDNHQQELQTKQEEVENLRAQMAQDADLRFKQLRDKHQKEIKDLKDKYETEIFELKQKIAQLESENQENQEIKRIYEEERIVWNSEKNKLDNQIKEEKLKQKKDLQKKESEILKIREQFENEMEELNTEYINFQETQKITINQKDQQIQQANEKLKQLQSDYEQKLRDKNTELQRIKQQLESQILEIQEQKEQEKEQLERNLSDLTSQRDFQLSSKDKEISKLSNKISQLQQEIKEKQQEITEKETQVEELEEMIRQTQNDGSNQSQMLQQQIDMMKTQFRQKESQIKELTDKLHLEQQSLREAKDQLVRKDKEMEKLQNELKALKETQKKQVDELQAKLEQANEQNRNISKNSSQNEQQLTKLLEEERNHKNKALSQVQDINSQLSSIKETFNKEQQLLKQVKDTLNQKLQEIQNLESDIKTLKESHKQQLGELSMKLEQAEQQNQFLSQNISTKENQLQKQIVDEKQQRSAVEKKLQDIKEQYEEFQQNQALAEKQINEQKQLIEQKDQQVNKLQNELKSQKDSYERQLNEQTHKYEQISEQNKLLSQNSSQAEQQLMKQIEEERSLKEKATKEKQSLQNNLQELQQQLSHLKQSTSDQVKGLQDIIANKDKEILNNQQILKQLQDKIIQLEQHINDLESEQKYTKSMRQSLQTKLDAILKESEDKDKIKQQHENSFNQQLHSTQEQLAQKEAEVNSLTQQVDQLKQQIANLNNEKQQSLNQEQQINLLKNKEQQQNKQVEDLKKQISNIRAELDSSKLKINSLNQEKEKLLEQLTNLNNQIKQKSQELEESEQINQQNEQLLKEQLQTEQELVNRVKELEDEVNLLQEANQEWEEKEEKHLQTIEHNRNLIQMLKNELEKTIDKQKAQEHLLQSNLTDKESELNNQIQEMREKQQELRNYYEQKLDEQKQQIEALEQDNNMKNELVEEVNKVIEEFNDEKHMLKAKIKHLRQVLDNVEQESSYKEDDEIDLEECFERFEQEFIKSKNRMQDRIESLERDNSLTREQLIHSKDEVNNLQVKMAEVQAELMNAINKQESNDIEMRKQIETATRKVQNYRDKLVEKVKEAENLKALYEKQVQKSQDAETGNFNLLRDKNELFAKLQQAEQQIENLKNRPEAKPSPRDLPKEEIVKRIEAIEEQLIMLRKQIFLAKDQVLDQLTDIFAKKFKDLQNTYLNENIMRGKLSEMKNESQLQSLNNNIKMIKQLVMTNKKLLVVQVISNNECYIIDDSKLDESSQNYIKQFLPAPEKELDATYIHIDDREQREMEKLDQKLQKLKDERNQIYEDLRQIKQKYNQSQIDSDRQKPQLEDQNTQLSQEISELKLKLKDLQQQNLLQKIRIIELNEMIKEFTNKSEVDSGSRKMIKLIEDNDNLRHQLAESRKRLRKKGSASKEEGKGQMTQNNDENELEEGSFFQGIEIADNVNRSHQDQDDVNLFDQSSIYGVMEGFQEGEEDLRKQKDLKIKQLELQLDEIQSRNKTLQTELQKSQQNLNQSEQGVIDNIKGTLIQFLKNCPLTEKNNEILLEIIFSMMMFTKEEIVDLQDKRKRARSTSVSAGGTDPDEELKKSAKKGIFNMFKKKEGSLPRKEENVVSPLRPIKR